MHKGTIQRAVSEKLSQAWLSRFTGLKLIQHREQMLYKKKAWNRTEAHQAGKKGWGETVWDVSFDQSLEHTCPNCEGWMPFEVEGVYSFWRAVLKQKWRTLLLIALCLPHLTLFPLHREQLISYAAWRGSSYLLRSTGTLWLCKIIFPWSSTQVVIAVQLSLSNIYSFVSNVYLQQGNREKRKKLERKGIKLYLVAQEKRF